MSFRPGAPAAAEAFESSLWVRKSGAVVGRSNGLRLGTGVTSGEVTTSGTSDSPAVAVAGWALTLVWHLGQRTVNGRDGALAWSSCRRASHFGQMRTMIVSRVNWLVYLVIQLD